MIFSPPHSPLPPPATVVFNKKSLFYENLLHENPLNTGTVSAPVSPETTKKAASQAVAAQLLLSMKKAASQAVTAQLLLSMTSRSRTAGGSSSKSGQSGRVEDSGIVREMAKHVQMAKNQMAKNGGGGGGEERCEMECKVRRWYEVSYMRCNRANAFPSVAGEQVEENPTRR